MKRRDQEDFLKDVFADEGLDALRESTLARGLSTVRRRRNARAVGTFVLAGASLLVLAATMLWPRPKYLTVAQAPVVVASTAAPPRIKIYPATVASDSPPIAIISDEELLNLFGDHPVALLGSAGRQRLVVFDKPQKITR